MAEESTVFEFGKRYEIVSPSPEDEPYTFVVPLDYADGTWLGDCWIVDEHGNVHPGYNVLPVPFHRDSVREVS